MDRPMLPCDTTLHHVGIVVPTHEQVDMLVGLLGLRRGHSQNVPAYAADCVFTMAARPGGACIEFVVPHGGKLAEFNRGRGGLHHIALAVASLDEVATALRAQDIELLEVEPVVAGDLRINFLPPVHTRGFIVEFVEERSAPVAASEQGCVPHAHQHD